MQEENAKVGQLWGQTSKSVVSQWHSKAACQGAQVKSELVLSWVSLESFYGQGKEKKKRISIPLDHFSSGNA